MAKPDYVPTPAVGRLSLYLRELETLFRQERQTISSRQLGQALGLTDAQVRKDLAYFGQFGHPGIGYRVHELIARIRGILGTDRGWNALLVGAGNLGRALLSYRGFAQKGFQVVAVFDNDLSKIGKPLDRESRMEILAAERMGQVIRDLNVQIGIIAVPAEAAQGIADALVIAGIKGILNFAPASLSVPEAVALATVDLALCLEQLVFRVNTQQVAASVRKADADS
ncbi:MAG: redox-sensing transcriptional repressor Rex [Phycisphaerales bacterium]|nr:redox-sensing transcriptional repressor Rex [Phycisphaerales bacterium]